MTDFSDFRRRHSGETRPLYRRARSYLRTRPTESWLFLFAGIVLGAFFG